MKSNKSVGRTANRSKRNCLLKGDWVRVRVIRGYSIFEHLQGSLRAHAVVDEL